MVNDVAQVKRKGNKVVSDLMKGLLYNKGKEIIFYSYVIQRFISLCYIFV